VKKSLIFKILLALGICPFLYPFIAGIYTASVESMFLSDYLILYSFLYWPTYIIGAALIIFSVIMLCRIKK